MKRSQVFNFQVEQVAPIVKDIQRAIATGLVGHIFKLIVSGYCPVSGKLLAYGMEYNSIGFRKCGISIVYYQSMELEYQSHRNVDIQKQLNRLDKVTSKLSLTVKDLGCESLPQHLKDKIVNLITKDSTKQLLRLLDKEVVTWEREVGVKATNWNTIHLCAKFNAVGCARALLKQIYQEGADQYVQAVNVQTAEGFTPLMICIIYHGDKVLELLLQLGGVDLSIIERGKLRAYDLALHYRNECAISHLIVYEDRCRKKQFLNEQQLQKPEAALEEPLSFCESMSSYLLDCLICFKYEEEVPEQLFGKKGLFFKNQFNENIDAVKVGSRRDIEDYQILWKPLSGMEGQKAALFDSFKPQDICESQFSLKNTLILNQTLSDYPWLLRRVITKIDSLPGQPQKYSVQLYHNMAMKKIEVDECMPVIKERGEPMFISNRSEIWPMILQKALAKIYGSYLALNTLSPSQTLETITGFHVKEIPIAELAGGVVSAIQDLSLRGYMVLLQGRPRTELNTGAEVTSFAVLNCYEKGSTKKILISCPTIIQNWHQTKDIRQLAILKAHFSRLNQSCLWIDQSKVGYYFRHVTVVFLKEGYTRSDLKMKLKIKGESDPSVKVLDEKQDSDAKEYRKSIFFKFKIEKGGEDPILLQVTDLETRHKFDLSQLQGWRNQGSDALIREEEHPNCPELAKFTCSPGQYLCKFQLKTQKLPAKGNHNEPAKGIIRKKEEKQTEEESSENHSKRVRLNLGPEHLRELQLVAWAPQQLPLELLEEEFGTIEWLENYRNYVDRHWDRLRTQGQQFFTESVNGKTIIVTRKVALKKVFLVLEGCGEEAVVEGRWSEIQSSPEVKIELTGASEGGCLYCVLSGVKLSSISAGKMVIE